MLDLECPAAALFFGEKSNLLETATPRSFHRSDRNLSFSAGKSAAADSTSSVPLSALDEAADCGSACSVGQTGNVCSAGSPIKCQRTEVLVVGNGPCGMTLSFMLAGNAPFYVGDRNPHPNKLLHNKLMESANPMASLLEQVLELLSPCPPLPSCLPLIISLLFPTGPGVTRRGPHRPVGEPRRAPL